MYTIFKIRHIFKILALFGVCSVNAQSLLPFVGDYTINAKNSSICLDNIVPVPGGSMNTSKNLIVNDFDGDGYDDILVAEFGINNIVAFRNNSGNGFIQVVAAVTPTLGVLGQYNSITLGDFDGLGGQDLAISRGGTVEIYANTGGFNFATTPNYSFAPVGIFSPSVSLIKSTKLNGAGDQLSDIILASSRTGTVAGGLNFFVFHNVTTAGPTYSFVQNYSIQPFPGTAPLTASNDSLDFDTGDIDNDGYHDVMLVYGPKEGVALFLKSGSNAGALTYSPCLGSKPFVIQSYNVNFGACRLADIDKNGQADIVVITRAVSSVTTVTLQGVTLLMNNTVTIGSPTFQPQLFNQSINTSTLPPFLPFTPNAIDLVDMNHDGFKDLILINDSKLWIYFWDSIPKNFNITTNYSITIDLPPGTKADQLLKGNFDNNGLPDLYFSSWKSNLSKPGVIPNFSYSFNDNVVPASICAGKNAVGGVNITQPLTTFINTNHTVTWFRTAPTPTANLGVGSFFTFTAGGHYYPVLTFPFPFSAANCKINMTRLSDTLIVIGLATPTLNILPTGSTICSGVPVTLTATSTGSLPGIFYVWATPQGTVLSQTITVNPLSPTSYSLVGVNPNLCKDSTIKVLTVLPGGATVSIPPTAPVCPGGSITLLASPGSSLNGTKYYWSTPQGTLSGFSINMIPAIAGTYSVKAIDMSNCTDSCLSVVSIFPMDTFSIHASDNVICIGDSVNLSVSATSFTWSTGSILPNIFVNPKITTTYSVKIIDTNSCVSSKSENIIVDPICDIKIYTTVTPNGDFINDFFTIDNINRYPNNQVQIFNRWGASLYNQNGYDNVNKFWPAHNSNYPPSTYYYVVDLGNGSPKIKGWLEVISN